MPSQANAHDYVLVRNEAMALHSRLERSSIGQEDEVRIFKMDRIKANSLGAIGPGYIHRAA